MDTSPSHVIKTLKKELVLTIIRGNYDLLSPEILSLSKQLDDLMIPIFKNQLEEASSLNVINH